MRRRGRTYLVGAASAASVLALVIAPAAGAAKPKSNPNLVSCRASLTVQVPAGNDQVLPNQSPGKQWGAIHCGKGVGSGLEEFSYKIPVSGEEVGTFVAYFGGATIKGKLALLPQEGSLLPAGNATFGFASFAGGLTHMSATGGLASSASGPGSATCVAQDGVHFKCSEKL